jgi:galactokinase
VDARQERLETALGSAPCLWARAPGRVNLMGGGLDYNECFVLPVAVDLDCLVATRPRDDGRVRVRSLDVTPAEEAVDVAADGSDEPAMVEPAWGRYVAGVVRMLAALGRPPIGLDAVLESTVPQGAGLSSSAALEVACALALCEAADFEPPLRDLARACQQAEHIASGVPCGIMDQLVSLLAEPDAALLIDCRSLEVKPVPIPESVAIAAVHSGLTRELRSSEWAERRASSEEAARRLGLRSLRDATLNSAESDPIARHVVTENQRVLETARALEEADLTALGDLFAASHASLRDDFRVSTPELDALVEALLQAGAVGARLTGGGFGGCIVPLLEEAGADAVLSEAAAAYVSETGRSPTVYRFGAVGGRASLYRGSPSSGIGSHGAA